MSLHRIHAENWGGDVATHYPDEAARIAMITARLAERAEQVITLQEVSGDQLAALRAALPGRTFHSLRYPRVPRPRTDAPFPLHDPAEHLVLLVDGPSRMIAADAFPDDPGKGVLVIEAAGTVVVATHLTGDARSAGQLARLAESARTEAGRPAVLLGDFNADRRTVLSALGAEFDIPALPDDGPPTRPFTSAEGSPGKWIDHVVVRAATVTDAQVVPVGGLSDHNLVRAVVQN
ncbi:endonuclease/exonuclease/phosphatase family protein [Streptacidiphilus rugosus]|uniref:endonuclease/exonuclease/phosphatase family protein n=1 Tax=Streptacidiphilus rugosus TaxID=405783 RepID=UPI000A734366|nr:endonuclease/exonuclease/phosphatase family protein [Streptacidiphilus rugosus]